MVRWNKRHNMKSCHRMMYHLSHLLEIMELFTFSQLPGPPDPSFDRFAWFFKNLRCTTLHFIKYNCNALDDAVLLDTRRISLDNFPTMSSFPSHPNNWTLGTQSMLPSSRSKRISTFAWASKWNLLVMPNPVYWNWCKERNAQALKFVRKLWKAS